MPTRRSEAGDRIETHSQEISVHRLAGDADWESTVTLFQRSAGLPSNRDLSEYF